MGSSDQITKCSYLKMFTVYMLYESNLRVLLVCSKKLNSYGTWVRNSILFLLVQLVSPKCVQTTNSFILLHWFHPSVCKTSFSLIIQFMTQVQCLGCYLADQRSQTTNLSTTLSRLQYLPPNFHPRRRPMHAQACTSNFQARGSTQQAR